jgi:hypothetical protein
MNARARNFLAANEVSPVVYGSVDDGTVTYRLANGKMFHLSEGEARLAPHPRWSFAQKEMDGDVLKEERLRELTILERIEAESSIPELQPERGE